MAGVTLSTATWTALGPAPINTNDKRKVISGRVQAAAPTLGDLQRLLQISPIGATGPATRAHHNRSRSGSQACAASDRTTNYAPTVPARSAKTSSTSYRRWSPTVST
jgi:hypothetical protein